MGLDEVYDFLDDNMDRYVDDFFNQIRNRVYTVKQFKKMIDNYNFGHIVDDYVEYLKLNDVRECEAYDDEIFVIGSRFYYLCIKRFGEED